MKTNREIALELLIGHQIKYLELRYGNNYKSILEQINNKSNFENFINASVDEDKELTIEEKIRIKAELKENISTTNFLNTEYESFADWHILKSAYDKFMILNPDYDLTSKLYLGTVLSDQISADTGYEDDIDALFILFDGELINLALQLSKIVVRSLPICEEAPHIVFPINLKELQAKIFDDVELKQCVIGGLYFSIYKRPKDFSQGALKTGLQNAVSLMLIESIEYFIFSHEVGHYLNGDLVIPKKKLSPEEKLKKDWDDEYMADLFGLNKIIGLYESTNSILSLLGPEIFFNFLILREKYDERIKGSTSQPTATERLNAYRGWLPNFLDEEVMLNFELYQALIDFLFQNYELIVTDFAKFNKALKEYNRNKK